MTFKELKQIAEWGEEGKLQRKTSLGWGDYIPEAHALSINLDASMFRRRPEKRLRAWKDISGVPLDAWFRHREKPITLERIIATRGNDVMLSMHGAATLEHLHSTREYSLDGKTNWLPCGVEVEE